MLSQGQLRRSLFLLLISFLVITTLFIVQRVSTGRVSIPKLEDLKPGPSTPTTAPKVIYKPEPAKPPPIVDNFPLAAKAQSPSDLPSIPTWNVPPSPHVDESTPLFIGFTRNWPLLQQVVVSYITAGWPPQDIYVVENTGVMRSNRDGLLTLQNPFYLDHHRLTKILGINVIQTPTLFTFAQLQNFFTFTALEHNWSHYFWAHMDTVAVSDEEWEGQPWKPLYTRALDALRETLDPAWGPLATRWFRYDHLALVRTQAFVDVGGWDTMITFYMTDCDMHERLWMKGFRIEEAMAGKIWDVATALDDLEVLYHRGGASIGLGKREDTTTLTADQSGPGLDQKGVIPSEGKGIQRSSVMYHEVLRQLDKMQQEKGANKGGRNTWQARQGGGQGEPFYRDPEGFELSLGWLMDFGKKVFYEKWGRDQCDLRDSGMVADDAWRVVLDWEKPAMQKKYWKDKAREDKDRVAREKEEAKAKEKDTTAKEEAKPAI